ncbi:DNA-directed RNA polymerase, mitochondrial-like isoform X2 [Ptychodera flava]|uniref:DNA-directed RNA polymerase, mitochondrial-like isoform X2 n=1 Tax=Ptychodera flava TaxID=63121 RepID=UPI00396A7900
MLHASRCSNILDFCRVASQGRHLFQQCGDSSVTKCLKCHTLFLKSSVSRTGVRNGHRMARNDIRATIFKESYKSIYQEKKRLLQALERRKMQLQKIGKEKSSSYQVLMKEENEWDPVESIDVQSVSDYTGVNFNDLEVVSIHPQSDCNLQNCEEAHIEQNLNITQDTNLHYSFEMKGDSSNEHISTPKEDSSQKLLKSKAKKKTSESKTSARLKTEEKEGEKSKTQKKTKQFLSENKKSKTKPTKKRQKDMKSKEAGVGISEDDFNGVAVGSEDKQSAYYQYMTAFLDVCANNNMIEYANSHINSIGYANHSKLKPDVYLFNIQLKGWARKGEITLVKLIFEKMKENGVKPNHQSYAAALECLGRRKKTDTETIEKILSQMMKEKLVLEELFQCCSLSTSQREYIMKAICAVRTDFNAETPYSYGFCDNILVKDIYSGIPDNSEKMTEYGTSTCGDIFDNKHLRQMVRQQIKVELNGGIKLDSIEAMPYPDKETLKKRKILHKHKEIWKDALISAFKNLKKQSKGVKSKWQFYPFFCVLEPNDYCNIMLDYIPQIAGSTEGEALLSASNELGRKIFKKYALHYKIRSGVADKIKSLYMDYAHIVLDDVLMTKYQFREYWHKLNSDAVQGPTLNLEAVPWNKITMSPHPLLVDLIKDAKEPELWFDSEVLPMLSPPLPWTSNKHGGYLLASTKIMRSRDDMVIHDIVMEQTEQRNLFPVFDSLNQLGAVPWKINQRMLDLITAVFLDKGSVELDIPQPVTECRELPQISENLELSEMTALRKERMMLRRQKAEMHSLRMDFLYKLSIANKYRNNIFWFPHNMDFRGRVYPCPPHFNHLGSDPMRSILLFAKGHPLGKHGLKWLKIHLINLTGLRKRNSLKDREEYADSIIDDILDSADNPMTGRKWWQKTDEPWQVLASCMEIANAIRSPDPAKYVSNFPVHQDGSCNGLQHYAALGRDVIGAHQVNLHPFDVPQDVYSGVAQKVEEARKEDAENGIKIAQVLEGFVERKVVKQTVMTVVYGVTRFGGHRQILKQLKDLPNFPEEYQWEAAGYLVSKVFQSLREMFTKTREIQDWFTASCKAVCKAGRPMEWVTPLGLPIIQSYQRRRSSAISYGTKDKQGKISQAVDSLEKPDTKKQTNAFAPNFIHSIDSTHMMLTSLFCQKAGITFVSVHDCYWTHPSTVDIMNKICREQFVALHKTPILEQLSEFMVKTYADLDEVYKETGEEGRLIQLLQAVPERGDFDLKNVLQSTYFFS